MSCCPLVERPKISPSEEIEIPGYSVPNARQDVSCLAQSCHNHLLPLVTYHTSVARRLMKSSRY